MKYFYLIINLNNNKMKKPFSRKYNCADPDLGQKGDLVAGFVLRDLARFAGFNYIEADRLRLIALTTEFKELPPDEHWEGLKADEVNKKNNLRQALGLAMNPVRDRIKLVFGEMSALYRSLRLADVTKASDHDYYFAVRNVLRLATTKKALLAPRGLTDAMLTALEAALKAFDDQIDVAKNAEAIREEETEKRIIKGNNLYAELVLVCEMGKSTWADESPAKYQDYVIYETKPGKGNVSGKATDSVTGAVVANVMIEIEELDDVVMETDENGNFLMVDIEPGTYTFLADADGYESQRRTDIKLESGKTIVVNFIMVKASAP
jgi:uncharacterized surface anchored protein